MYFLLYTLPFFSMTFLLYLCSFFFSQSKYVYITPFDIPQLLNFTILLFLDFQSEKFQLTYLQVMDCLPDLYDPMKGILHFCYFAFCFQHFSFISPQDFCLHYPFSMHIIYFQRLSLSLILVIALFLQSVCVCVCVVYFCV